MVRVSGCKGNPGHKLDFGNRSSNMGKHIMNDPASNSFHASLPGSTTGASPRITHYPPAWRGLGGLAVAVFAGGGYGRRSDHEGEGYATCLAAEGIAAFVVDYRVAPDGARHPAMLEDAQAAIATIRRRAAEFDIDPEKLGVVGSSAGGHLAAHAMVAWAGFPGPDRLRPAFGVLCYPVIHARGPHAHTGSMQNLLGQNPPATALNEVAVVDRVGTETPPAFLWHTLDDPSVPVENSLDFASALRRHGVAFELHVYQRGGHGLGRKTALPWMTDCLRWLREFSEQKGS